jgi:hypothetical protein
MLIRTALVLQAVGVLSFSLLVTADEIESGEVVTSRTCPSLSVRPEGCSTCGVTRGVAAMGSFEWKRAWDYNPISVALFSIEVLLLIWLLRPVYRRGPTPRGKVLKDAD